MDAILDHLDVSRSEVISHLRTGGTLADLADRNGSSGPELEAALVDAVADVLAGLVAEGRITQERADRLLERATVRIGVIVYAVHTPGRGR